MEIDETVIVPITYGFVEIVKHIDNEKKLERFYPLFSMGFSLLLSFGFVYSQSQDWFLAIITGLVYGLTASGLYSSVKAIKG